MKWCTIYPATCAHCGIPVTAIRHICEQAIKDWLAMNTEVYVLSKPASFVYETFRKLQGSKYSIPGFDSYVCRPTDNIIRTL